MCVSSIMSCSGAIAILLVESALASAPANQRAPASYGRNGSYGFDSVGREHYTSPSGEFSLDTAPVEPLGEYGCAYRFTAKDEVLWSDDRPYTLRQVTVTDQGAVVGFAYSVFGDPPPAAPWTPVISGSGKYLHVVILGPDGNELLHDVVEGDLPLGFKTAYPPQPLHPLVEQLVVDADNDRAVVVTRGLPPGADGDFYGATWTVYSVSTGRRVTSFKEDQLLGKDCQDSTKGDPGAPADRLSSVRPCIGRVVEAAPIRGAPLLLVHAVTLQRQQKGWDGRFVVIDHTGKEVWSLDARDDYAGLGECWDGLFSQCHFRDTPAILRTADALRFEIRLFAEKKLVAFQVARGEDGSWIVRELERVDYL